MHPNRPRFRFGPRAALVPAALGVALLTCASCSTQQIGPETIALSTTGTDPTQGALIVEMAPDSPQAQNAVQYQINIDGNDLVDYSAGIVTVGEGNETSCGYLPGGAHHVEIISPSDGSALFAGDYQVLGGQMNRLYLFGQLGVLASHFVSFSLVPATGMQHVSLMNLLNTGQTIEAVSCSGGEPEICSPISPPLTYGQSFDADVPGTSTTTMYQGFFVSAPGFGFRQVANAAVPTPPVWPFRIDFGAAAQIIDGAIQYPANYVSAPVLMSLDGSLEWEFN